MGASQHTAVAFALAIAKFMRRLEAAQTVHN